MPFILRPFSEQDYEALAVINNATYPEHRTNAEDWRSVDQQFSEGGYILHRYMVVETDTQQVVGLGSIQHAIPPMEFHPQKFKMHLMVRPQWRRRGVGNLIFEHLMDELRTLKAVTVWAGTGEDNADALAFLQKRGFVEIMRGWELWLSVAGANLSQFLPVAEHVASQGILITTLEEERGRDPDYLRKLHELSNAAFADVPPDRFKPVPFEDFVRGLEQPNMLPDAYFIAKHGNRYIGFSSLAHWEGTPERLTQEGIGVRQEYRRRSVGTALKVKTIEYARRHGYKTIAAWDYSTDTAILALNEKLGFRRHAGYVYMEKSLQG